MTHENLSFEDFIKKVINKEIKYNYQDYIVTPLTPYMICDHFFSNEIIHKKDNIYKTNYLGRWLEIKSKGNNLMLNENYSSVVEDEIIVVETVELENFVNKILPQIDKPIILFTCRYHLPQIIRSDFTDKCLKNPKIKLWISQNPIYTNHKKYMAFPYGLNYKFGEYINFIANNFEITKKYKIFNAPVGIHRHLPENHARKVYPELGKDINMLPFQEYLRKVSESKFTISTVGDRDDCFRHYETIGLNSIPISDVSDCYKNIFNDNMVYKKPESIVKILNNNINNNITVEHENDEKTRLQLKYKKPNRNLLMISYWHNIIKNKISNICNMNNTLVIILSETRAHELTFNNFKKNVLDQLNADLCLCIGVKSDYDYNNPFYKIAKHKFLYNEPDDFGDAFDYAYEEISKNRRKYEKLENINCLYRKAKNKESSSNITFYGNKEINPENFDDDEIVMHTSDFPDELWRNEVYGIKHSDNNNFVEQENVITFKKPLHWREFLKIKDQFLGGIKDKHNQHPGSAGILIFFRWFLLKNLVESGLINKYKRFIITRSDFIYQLPHPKIDIMNESNIWIPDSEHWFGYTDRHVVLNQNNLVPYLNILNNMVLRSNEYFIKMKQNRRQNWNLEQLIKFNLQQNGVLHNVKEFPYVMYTVRNINGTTRWKSGEFSDKLGYYIKYDTEYKKSSEYKTKFEQSKLTIDEFYKTKI
jgi:hypothetical protein